ncbi:glycosyltransferase family 4 protein, partial [Candidatus Roizmanbacteria bacterium]|nr:glycosyltransferase family 4 protein [Candidatus Roizmanbacteria bacterium]
FQKRDLRKVSAVITDSHNSKKDIVRHLNIPAEKISVVHLAADEQFRKLSSGQLKRMNLSQIYSLPERFLLYVGDVNWNKNLSRLISAFSSVTDRNVSLVMVGKALTDESTPETRSIIEQIKKKGLQNKILRLGFLPKDHLVGIYNTAIGYIQPSLYEGFGLPVLEAMQCGIPVISSTTSSLSELTGQAVISIDPLHSSSILEGITTLLYLEKKDREKLVKAGYEQVKKFSWEKVAHDTAAVYRHVCQTI